jgi:transposase InsO family protein
MYYGKEFCGRAMLNWAHARHVTLRLIEPGTPNQNAYLGSFSGRLRDERLNEHEFLNLAYTRAEIEQAVVTFHDKLLVRVKARWTTR